LIKKKLDNPDLIIRRENFLLSNLGLGELAIAELVLIDVPRAFRLELGGEEYEELDLGGMTVGKIIEYFTEELSKQGRHWEV
jgi:hypothetical protein